MARAGRLFHTIVVVGASVGCGSGSTTEFGPVPLEPADAGAPLGSSASPTKPTDCALPSQFHCNGTGRGACSCDLTAPNSVCDCARPGEFRCRECLSGPPVLGRCPNDDGVDCFCNTSIAVASPTDCGSAAQFVCEPPPSVPSNDVFLVNAAYSDWFAFGECACDPTRPTSQGDCTGTSRFECSVAQLCEDPPSPDVDVDCSCLPPVIPIQ